MQTTRILAPLHPHETLETIQRLQTIAEALSGELTTLSVIEASREDGEHGSALFRNIVLHGDPAARIRDYASLHHPDFILMPLRPTRFRFRFWQPSVIADILRRTRNAVMVVPVASRGAMCRHIRMVLCVVNLDGHDDPVIDAAAAIAARAGAGLTLLNVVPAVDEGTLVAGFDSSDAPLSLPLASERMSSIKISGQAHHVEIRSGSLHRNIAAVAQEVDADLIVTGRSCWRWNYPSMPRLQRSVACPVLSVAT